MSPTVRPRHPAGVGTNRKLRWMLIGHGLTHPVTPIPPWRMGEEADAIRLRYFTGLVARWCAEGRLSCECCGRRGATVGYAGHVERYSIMCSGCVFGVECWIGRCGPKPPHPAFGAPFGERRLR